MSHKKLIGLLAVPIAVAAVGGGAIMLTSHQANAQSSPSTQQSVDKPEPGDTPDKPGQPDQDQQNKNGQKDAETND